MAAPDMNVGRRPWPRGRVAGLRGRTGEGGHSCSSGVAVDRLTRRRQLRLASAPWPEPVPNDPERVTRGAGRVSTESVGAVGVTVEHPQQPSDTPALGEPRREHRDRSPSDDPGGEPGPLKERIDGGCPVWCGLGAVEDWPLPVVLAIFWPSFPPRAYFLNVRHGGIAKTLHKRGLRGRQHIRRCPVLLGPEELSGRPGLDHHDQVHLDGPRHDPGDGAHRAASACGEVCPGHAGYEPRLPAHPAHEPAKHREGDGPSVGAPQLGVDEVLDARERRSLVGEDDPPVGDAMAPPGVRQEAASVYSPRGAGPPVGE